MWTAVRKGFDGGEKVSLISAGAHLSFAAVLDAWRTDRAFSDFFLAELAATPFEAFFWEMPPIIADDIDQPYEYVTVDSPALPRAREDGSAFASRLAESGADRTVTAFHNPSGSAILVSPLPIAPGANAHIAPFAATRTAGAYGRPGAGAAIGQPHVDQHLRNRRPLAACAHREQARLLHLSSV
jgi:hypothetical protein